MDACSMKAVLIKMALDQLLMAPLFLVAFFFAILSLEGQPHKLPEVLYHSVVQTDHKRNAPKTFGA